MIPIFTHPLGFLSLLAIPGLVAIYLLRTRSRRYTVSSLMLWVNQRQARAGGLRVERLQMPLLFFLELLTIILLALAVAAPIIRTARGAIPLIVVLDDSFSMLAGDDNSVRNRALAAIEKVLEPERLNLITNRRYAVRFVLAGAEPQMLNEAAKTAHEATAQLEDWRCLSPFADLARAITFAADVGGARTLILVLTDEPPSQPLDSERIQWWSFGISQPNAAFVNATRTATDSGERCLFEITNLSRNAAVRNFVVTPEDSSTKQSSSALHHSTLEIGPMATRRIILNLSPETPSLRARIDDDALAIDNEVVLLPQRHKPVLVDVRIRDQQLRLLVEDALASTDRSIPAPDSAELVFVGNTTVSDISSGVWYMYVISEPEASAYLGPFVVDQRHPLTEGLSFGGVVWGAGKTEAFMGNPVITAGNVPLLTDTERFTGSHELRIRLRPDLSTLQHSPNWPALIWNLLDWRASETAGLERTNLRLGETAVLKTELGTESVQVISPDGAIREQSLVDRTANVKIEAVGIYKLHTASNRYAFASNALYQEESDLTNKATGRWGDWGDATLRWWGYESFAWFFLLLAIGILALHQILARREA